MRPMTEQDVFDNIKMFSSQRNLSLCCVVSISGMSKRKTDASNLYKNEQENSFFVFFSHISYFISFFFHSDRTERLMTLRYLRQIVKKANVNITFQ